MEKNQQPDAHEKKRLFTNVFSLSVLQGVNYLLPLITLPYLVRVLGAEKFGLIMFAQAFMQYFVYLTDFGFELSATKDVAVHRDNAHKVVEIFNSVMLIKLVLMLISFVILNIVVFNVAKFTHDWLVYLFTFGMVLGNLCLPVWFFQGQENMKDFTLLNILAKSIILICIFTFIRSAADYLYVPLLNSIGLLVAGVSALWLIFKKYKMKIVCPGFKTMKAQLVESSQFFFSRASVMTYTSSNAFFLGLHSGTEIVGYYSAAEKLYMAFRSLYNPLNNALYPFMSKTNAVRFFKKIFKLTVVLNTVICILGYVFAEKIIIFVFGSEFEASIAAFRIFLLVILFIVPSVLFGYPFLAALGHQNIANMSVIIASSIHILGLIFLTVSSLLNIYSITVMVLITEFIVFCIRSYGVKKHKLWRTD